MSPTGNATATPRPATSRVIFAPGDPAGFGEDVKRRVAAYFESSGISTKANASMVIKTIVLLLVTFGSYGLILSGLFSPWQMLGLAVLMGVGTAGIGFGIAHDALHGAYSSRPWVNRMLGFSFELAGASGYMWKITHNVIHHTYPNIHGLDEDLEVSPLLRLSPEAKLKPIHRFQHLYAAAAYSLSTLNWVFMKDYKYFLMRELGPFREKKHQFSEVALLLGSKLFYYTYTIVIPLLVLDIAWWQFAIGFLVLHLTAGFILGIVFQLAHVVEETEHPIPSPDGTMDTAWMIHQMETTSNFAMSNRWLSWYVGGLNFQVEHHLFPKVCSVHYPAISKIVRETAAAHGVPHHHHETMREAVRSHLQTLKRLGNPTASAA
ncbi:MAG: acyl-CoA desaturase [Candidatus Eisenbacteria bacterium]